MKFNMNRRFALLSLAALLALGGCSEWTDMESVTIKEPQVEKSEAYMQAIRDYKASEHKVLIGWFDNVALPGDRSQHLTVLPDSIDIVVLQHPELITEALAAEAAEIRTRMGTRTLCSVSFAELEPSRRSSRRPPRPTRAVKRAETRAPARRVAMAAMRAANSLRSPQPTPSRSSATITWPASWRSAIRGRSTA